MMIKLRVFRDPRIHLGGNIVNPVLNGIDICQISRIEEQDIKILKGVYIKYREGGGGNVTYMIELGVEKHSWENLNLKYKNRQKN